tara:strand:+ start:1882 stop:2943 length:1062 start_codon:yes stop_codon:yes gene_type:complete
MLRWIPIVLSTIWLGTPVFAIQTIPEYETSEFCGPEWEFVLDFSDIDVALSELESEARSDVAAAQYVLANLYLLTTLHLETASDTSIPSDPERGIELLQSAAELGCADAQLQLGELYVRGEIVPFDRTFARWWFNQAYATGLPTSEQAIRDFELNPRFHPGSSPSSPTPEMIEWYRARGLAGNQWASIAMSAYASSPNGRRHWLTMAADQGNAEANTQLGDIYWDDYDATRYALVGADMTQAREYWHRAAELGDGLAVERLFLDAFRRDVNGGFDQSERAAEIFALAMSCVDGELSAYKCAGIVAVSYSVGFGVVADQDEAERWDAIAGELMEAAGYARFVPVSPQSHDATDE